MPMYQFTRAVVGWYPDVPVSIFLGMIIGKRATILL